MNQTINDDSYLEEFADREIENNVVPAKRVKLYIYPIMSIFKDNDNSQELLTYSPNVVNIKIIDPDIYQEIEAEEIENPQLGYVSKQALNSIDNELAIVDQTDKKYSTYRKVIRDPNKLYLVSEIQITEESYIPVFGQFLQRLTRSNMIGEESNLNQTIIETTSFESWKPKDSTKVLIKLHKQVVNFKVNKIKLKHPDSFFIEGIKMLGKDEKQAEGYSLIKSDSKITPIWFNPISVSKSGHVQILNFWMSGRILPYSKVKEILNSEDTGNEIKKLLFFEEEENNTVPTKKIENIDVLKINLSKLILAAGTSYDDPIKSWNENEIKIMRTPIWDTTMTFKKGEGFPYPLFNPSKLPFGVVINYKGANPYPRPASDGYLWEQAHAIIDKDIDNNISIEYSTKETVGQGSLFELLQNVLNASFNYNFNFKGAGYKNNETKELNYMALYKQEFEGKTISEYIDGLEKNWEQIHPIFVDSEQYSNYKKIRTMLSSYIYGEMSIGNNTKDDSQFLLPYFFELISKPLYTLEDGTVTSDPINFNKGNGIWKYNTIIVKVASKYLDDQLESKDNVIMSSKTIIDSRNDSFIWQNMPETVNESKFPSLRNSDIKTSDAEITKYLFWTADDNVHSLYGADLNIIADKNDLKNFISINSDMNFKVITNNTNPKFIELTGIFGFGNYDLIFEQDEKNVISIEGIELFKSDREDFQLMKIAF
ncbi:hypothetical protein LD119_00716 [Mesoplasma sp. JKS002660]|uniref:hypothetical protein n=1 Tax=Mesoplasma whartonense TaxID=2878854 RepID=UPI0020229FDF|nr:hypothetical protein [Mesoplasma sp. JKS002660]MCL8213765.1 hypothetical protein [Mesoplasma sp. JKS002660]